MSCGGTFWVFSQQDVDAIEEDHDLFMAFTIDDTDDWEERYAFTGDIPRTLGYIA